MNIGVCPFSLVSLVKLTYTCDGREEGFTCFARSILGG